MGINSKNYQEYIGAETDIVINANGSGYKSLANQNPKSDFDKAVKTTLDFVLDIKYDYFIQTSTIDVYPVTNSRETTREDFPIDVSKLHPYGFDRYVSELIVKKYCTNWLILRLGGLVGPNLNKNPIYDWTHNKPFFLSKESIFPFIHTLKVAEIIHFFIKNKVTGETINVCSSDSIKLRDLRDIYDFKIEESKEIGVLHTLDYNVNVVKLRNYIQPGTSKENIKRY